MAQNIVFFDNWNNEHNSANSVALNNYLTSLSKPELKKLISDPHWNSYPEYVYYKSMNTRNSTTHNPKDYFRIINPAIKQLLYSSFEYRKFFIKNSDGIFRIITINSTLGADKITAVKNGILSRDTRVRKLAATSAPISFLVKNLSNEKNSSVLSIYCKRIGHVNIPKALLSSPYRYHRSQAFLQDSFNKDEISELLMIKKSGGNIPFFDHIIVEKLAYHLSPEEIPFYLDAFRAFDGKHSNYLARKIFLSKLTGNSDV